MKELNVLFLSPNWRAALIEAFREAARAVPARCRFTGLDSDPHAPALRMLDASAIVPRFDAPGCLELALDFCRREKVDAVVPLIDRAVEFLDAHRADFAAAGARLLINGSAAIAVCHDKWRLARFLRERGIGAPETWTPEELGARPDFPLFAKKRRGEGGKDSMPVLDARGLEYCLATRRDVVLQRFLDGDEYSIDWCADMQGRPLAVVPRRRLAARAGEVMTSRVELRAEIIAAARAAGAALALKGPCTLQGFYRAADAAFAFTDINLRFGSGSIHSIRAGVPAPELILRELLGEPPPADFMVRDGSLMLRYSAAFFE